MCVSLPDIFLWELKYSTGSLILNLQTPSSLELHVYNEGIVMERYAIITADNNFEVIHLSTSHKGGAGIAARRLNADLNSIGVKSSFMQSLSKILLLG